MDHRTDLGLEDDRDASRGKASQLAAGRSSSMPRNQSSPAEEGEEDLRIRRRLAHGVRSARSSPVSQRRLWPPPSPRDARVHSPPVAGLRAVAAAQAGEERLGRGAAAGKGRGLGTHAREGRGTRERESRSAVEGKGTGEGNRGRREEQRRGGEGKRGEQQVIDGVGRRGEKKRESMGGSAGIAGGQRFRPAKCLSNIWAAFSSPNFFLQYPSHQVFKHIHYPSHQVFKHIHKVLNIVGKNN